MAGQLLADRGHAVVLHARDEARAAAARGALPGAEAVIAGGVSAIAAMRDVADQASRLGRFDAVMHDVGVGYQEPRRGFRRRGPLERDSTPKAAAPRVTRAP